MKSFLVLLVLNILQIMNSQELTELNLIETEIEIKNDKYCCGYDSLGMCNFCRDAYMNTSNSGCQPVSRKIQNCLTYESNRECAVCNFGYKKNSRGRCIENELPNCLVEVGNVCQVNFLIK